MYRWRASVHASRLGSRERVDDGDVVGEREVRGVLGHQGGNVFERHQRDELQIEVALSCHRMRFAQLQGPFDDRARDRQDGQPLQRRNRGNLLARQRR